jgi:hypothetical protein
MGFSIPGGQRASPARGFEPSRSSAIRWKFVPGPRLSALLSTWGPSGEPARAGLVSGAVGVIVGAGASYCKRSPPMQQSHPRVRKRRAIALALLAPLVFVLLVPWHLPYSDQTPEAAHVRGDDEAQELRVTEDLNHLLRRLQLRQRLSIREAHTPPAAAKKTLMLTIGGTE